MTLLFILKLFLFSAYFGSALGIYFVDSDSTYCQRALCINKCCPNDFYFYQRYKTCEPTRNRELEITAPVYDHNLKLTGKTVQDVFVFKVNAFGNNAFKSNSFAVDLEGLEAFITENGILYLRLPKLDHQWQQVERNDYCLDLRKKLGRYVTRIFVNVRHDEELREEYSFVQKYLGKTISCVFLFTVLVMYSLLPEPMNIRHGILIAYALSLFIAFMFYIGIQITQFNVPTCLSLSIVIYFFYLASSGWMNIMSFDIWWTFRSYVKARPIHRRGEKFKFAMYSLYAWGLPLVLTIALYVVNGIDTNMLHVPWYITPNIPNLGCYLEDGGLLMYLIVLMLVMCLISWLFLLTAGIYSCQLRKGAAAINSELTGTPAARRLQYHRLLLYLIITGLMTFKVLAEGSSIMWPRELRQIVLNVNVILEPLLGIGICVMFCNKETIMKIVKSFQKSKAKPTLNH